LAFYANEGKKALEALTSQKENFTDETPIRISGLSDHWTQMPYGSLKKLASNSIYQLTNQVFTMVYGNFEAFILDLVHDSLISVGAEEPQTEAIRMTMMTRWQGKIDRMREKFSLDMPQRTFREEFSDMRMEFLGERCTNPIELLEKLAEFRHRLVHSAGRADGPFLKSFPTVPFAEGEQIRMPTSLPFDLHYFFVPFTDIIDSAFAKRFNWPRLPFAPERFL